MITIMIVSLNEYEKGDVNNWQRDGGCDPDDTGNCGDDAVYIVSCLNSGEDEPCAS
jgi:hypothetical protein